MSTVYADGNHVKHMVCFVSNGKGNLVFSLVDLSLVYAEVTTPSGIKAVSHENTQKWETLYSTS